MCNFIYRLFLCFVGLILFLILYQREDTYRNLIDDNWTIIYSQGGKIAGHNQIRDLCIVPRQFRLSNCTDLSGIFNKYWGIRTKMIQRTDELVNSRVTLNFDVAVDHELVIKIDICDEETNYVFLQPALSSYSFRAHCDRVSLKISYVYYPLIDHSDGLLKIANVTMLALDNFRYVARFW